MQLINTIDTTFDIADHLAVVAVKGCQEVIELGRDFRPFFESACIHAIAAGISTRRWYERSGRQQLIVAFQVVVSILTIVAMVAGLFAIAAFNWLGQFIADQYAGANFSKYFQAEPQDDMELGLTAEEIRLGTERFLAAARAAMQ